MSSVVENLFGGTSTKGLKQQKAANEAARTDILDAVAGARQDAISLFPTAAENRNLGFQSALDVFGQTIPGQLDAFQQGNVGAQQAILAGLPQVQNAIFGLPTDLSGLQPQQLNINTDFAQQQLPDFVNPQLAQAAALGGQGGAIGADGLPIPGGAAGGGGFSGAGGAAGVGFGGGSFGGGTFGGGGGGNPFADTFNASELDRALGVPDIGSLAQLGLSENAGNIGRLASAITGVPGLGTLGNFLGNRNIGRKVWMSPVNPSAPFQTPITTPALQDLFGSEQLPSSGLGAGNTNPATQGGARSSGRVAGQLNPAQFGEALALLGNRPDTRFAREGQTTRQQ